MDDANFTVPRSLFKHDFGFGIDFGSSIIKLAYTRSEDDLLRFHLVNFSVQECDEMFTFLEGLCRDKLQAGMTYYLTGVGISSHKQQFEEKLNIRAHQSTEHTYCVDGFRFMSTHLPWEQFVYPPNEDIRKKAGVNAKMVHDILIPAEGGMGDLGRAKEPGPYIDVLTDLPQHRQVQYPTLYCQAGSGHYIINLDEDGMYLLMDPSPFAGKTLLGLGNILLGAKTYDDIVDLASRGNADRINTTIGEVGDSATDETYSSMQGCDLNLFAFGKAAQRENTDMFSREDIAAGLLSLVNGANAREAFTQAMLSGVKQVFFVGGMPSNSELIRNNIEKQFFEKCQCNPKGFVSDCLFVRSGGHLAAVGSLVKNLGLI